MRRFLKPPVVGRLSMVVILLTSGSCASHNRAPEVMGRDVAVINAVLSDILRDDQCSSCLLVDTTQGFAPWLTNATGSLPPAEFEAEYRLRNASALPVGRPGISSRFTLVEKRSIDEMFREGPRVGWQRVADRYGPRTAIVTISEPVFSADGQKAILTYSYDYGLLNGQTDYVILSKSGAGWTISKRVNLVMT